MEEDRNYLTFAILRHFEDELTSSALEPDAKEALEGIEKKNLVFLQFKCAYYGLSHPSHCPITLIKLLFMKNIMGCFMTTKW